MGKKKQKKKKAEKPETAIPETEITETVSPQKWNVWRILAIAFFLLPVAQNSLFSTFVKPPKL